MLVYDTLFVAEGIEALLAMVAAHTAVSNAAKAHSAGCQVDDGIVDYVGRGKGTRYFISPMIVSNSKSNVKTSLKTRFHPQEPFYVLMLVSHQH